MLGKELMDMINDEPPVPNTGRFIASGALCALMAEATGIQRQIERDRKKAEHDANIRCNYRYCRKKCKLFKERRCYKKTFEEQKTCADSRGYEREEVLIPEVV